MLKFMRARFVKCKIQNKNSLSQDCYDNDHFTSPPSHFFRGKSLLKIKQTHLLKISMMDLPGICFSKKVLLSQMNLVDLPKKIFGKIWLSCNQKHNFWGAKFVSTILKMGSYGTQMWFYCLKYVKYFVTNVKTVTWMPPNLGLSQFKTDFLAMPIFCLSILFCSC